MNESRNAVSIEPSVLIETLEEFLVHAITLERESVERYEELADSMEIHNNPEISELFRKLAHFGELHAAEIEEHAAGMTLQHIPPWEFKWTTPEAPESGLVDEVDYLMDERSALAFALRNEDRGREFYAQVAAGSPNSDVRRLAREFANEEQEHVQLLQNWIGKLGEKAGSRPVDLDPPNVTE